MKLYIYAALVLALMAFAYWAYNAVYDSGFDAASAKYQSKISEAKDEHDEKQGELIEVHLKELKNVKSKTNARIRSLRKAKDSCLDNLMPVSVLERVWEERKSHSN